MASSSFGVPKGGTLPVFIVKSTVSSPASRRGTAASPYVAVSGCNDVLGYDKLNKYRVFGYIGQDELRLRLRQAAAGWLVEICRHRSHNFDLDRTTNQPSYNEKFSSGTTATSTLPPISQANINFAQFDLAQYQLFGEVELRPVDGVSIHAGVKYVHFTRGVDAVCNRDPHAARPQRDWTKTLPFLTANWLVTKAGPSMASTRQGMYVPDLSSFYSASGQLVTALDQ